MTKKSVILTNCADWHQRQSEIQSDPKARERHAEIADSLYIRAYWHHRDGR